METKNRTKSYIENYDSNNGERIEGKAIHSVLSAARERYGENYLVRNTQTYDNAHWIAEYNGTTKGSAGINDSRADETQRGSYVGKFHILDYKRFI